ncbi:MAG TPA: hypothetical protein VKR55_23560 [Bradyrhizobium sp.]|uniref:hypothetical protein n=1 Tax=Bradyrhizobium sp. TaxID=376 RepID=UPI002C2D8ACD|nr:hypothetical protein [Bradyrhizobium sp.]HLZ05116.1 hypothetical protein [Bradyrhizobium sp.]
MFRNLYAGAVVLLLLLIQASWGVNAQTSSAIIDQLRTTIGQTIGAQPDTVEIVVSGNVLTILRVNSSMNQSTHAGRDNEANAIAPIASKAIAGSPEFKKLHTIRVEYVARSKPGAAPRVIDTIDFRKSPAGSFEFHMT